MALSEPVLTADRFTLQLHWQVRINWVFVDCTAPANALEAGQHSDTQQTIACQGSTKKKAASPL